MKNFFFFVFSSLLVVSECIRCEVLSGGIPTSSNFECKNSTKFCIDLNVTTIETSITFKGCDDGLFVGDIQLQCLKPGTTIINSPNVKGTQFCCNTDLCNLDPNDISTTLPSNNSNLESVTESLRCEESVNGVIEGTNILCPDGTKFCISLYLTVYGTLLSYKECSRSIGISAGDKQFLCDKPGITDIDFPDITGKQVCCNTDLCNLNPDDVSTTSDPNSSETIYSLIHGVIFIVFLCHF